MKLSTLFPDKLRVPLLLIATSSRPPLFLNTESVKTKEAPADTKIALLGLITVLFSKVEPFTVRLALFDTVIAAAFLEATFAINLLFSTYASTF